MKLPLGTLVIVEGRGEGRILDGPKLDEPLGPTYRVRLRDEGETVVALATLIYVIPEREQVDHPKHYGGAGNPYEVIKVIRAWGLGFSLGNCVKYVARAGKKDPTKRIEDLKKARWYLNEEIDHLENEETKR